MEGLKENDFRSAARKLRCDVASIKAVASVESHGTGFYEDGFPTILFERHKFYKNADRAKRAEWSKQFPTICNLSPTPKGGYGSASVQRKKFNKAFSLDPNAAMEACSWGMFQELGENYIDLGFRSVGEFVDRMKSGPAAHLDIFVRSVKVKGIDDDLRNHDWTVFARIYNGPNFKKYKYDSQIKSAHTKYSKDINDSLSTDSTNPAGLTPSEQPANVSVETPADPLPVKINEAENGDGAALNSESPTEGEQNENAVGKTQETVSEKTETPDGKQFEKTTTEEKSTFNPQNLPAFIPRFGKQWFLGLIPGAGFLSTLLAKAAAMPDWLVFILGALTGIALWNFFALIIKHREKVLEFVTKCYEITADPTKNNLIPTSANGFVGLRGFEVRQALMPAITKKKQIL